MYDFQTWWQHLPQNINPVIFEIGAFKLQYYGLMYIVAFAITYGLAYYRLRRRTTMNGRLRRRRCNPTGEILDGDPECVEEELIYLAEKCGKFLPTDVRGRSRVIQWLMFQMGGIGPMMGQANVFYRYFPEKIPSVISRYQNEGRRLFEVLDTRLKGREFLCDEYSIADIATWPWAVTHNWSGIDIEGLVHLKAWLERMAERPAVARGRNIPERGSKKQTTQAGQRIIVT